MKNINLFYEVLICASLIVPFFLLTNGHESNGEGKLKKAVFAGGCFWCMEKPFEGLEGVVSVVSGYTGGTSKNPDYQNYSAGGHLEAIEIEYDPDKISYVKLLDTFWRQIDPTDPDGQFADRGKEYTSAIFYLDEDQKKLAEKSRKDLDERKVFAISIVTPVIPFATFYKAEEYHQDYYKKNPIRYSYYRHGSGRDQFLKSIWGEKKKNIKWSESELRKKLTPLQYSVTQEEDTESPFDNEYWDNKKYGIYVDIVSGEPLFSSLDKYDSGTGWPSFKKPLVTDNIIEKSDWGLLGVRIEVRSKNGNSHLGHVFDDGPAPTGKRYCINSAALKFIPVEDLDKEGYPEFRKIFGK